MAWVASGLAFGAVLLLMGLGMPIAIAMLLVGFAGIWMLMGEGAAFGMMGQCCSTPRFPMSSRSCRCSS